MTRLIVCIAIFCALSMPPAYAQEDAAGPVYRDLPLRTQGALQVFVETASFRGPQSMTRLEVYSLLDARQLQFVPEGGKYVSQIDFTAVLRDTTGQEVKRELWTRNVSVEDMRLLKQNGALVRDIIAFDLPAGGYQLSCTVEDIYGDRAGTCEGFVRVRHFNPPGLAVSDLVFSSELAPAEQEGRFVKNGWRVVPNVTRFFRVGDPIQFYFEIYNFVVDTSKPQDSFVMGYSLVDTGGVTIKNYPAKRLLKPGESVVKTETLSTEGLPGGVYALQIELFDRSTREHLRHQRRFFMISDEAQTPQLTKEEEEQLRYFRDIRYVAQQKDLNLYEKLPTQDAKMNFLKAFWKKLDPTPETPLNERLRDHMIRVRYADENFTSEPGKLGSDTDKGRVYVKYGPPDERDYATSASSGKAVDTWVYEKSGRYIFVFFDRRGTGVYELVHSTMSGELYNPEWQRSEF